MFDFQMNNRRNLLLKVQLVINKSSGPLAQSAERGADNAKVVSSTLTRTILRQFLNYLRVHKNVCAEVCVSVTFLLILYISSF